MVELQVVTMTMDMAGIVPPAQFPSEYHGKIREAIFARAMASIIGTK
jgi:hypothetical protein